MGRKWGPCAEPRCPTLVDTTYCTIHQPVAYATSTRRSRLPSNWDRLRRSILIRDNHTCYLCHDRADRVDHIEAGDDHHPSNLAAICLPCDQRKSGHEGGSTQGRYRP